MRSSRLGRSPPFSRSTLDEILLAFAEKFATKGCAYPDLAQHVMPIWSDSEEVGRYLAVNYFCAI